MSSKAEQYRCYGEKALASAKQATCEEEKAELLKIAEAWFELAGEQSDRRTRNQRQSSATAKLWMSAIGTKRTSPSCTAHVRFWG